MTLSLKSQFALSVTLGVAIGVGLPWLAVGRTGGELTHRKDVDYGVVTSIENCKAGKSRLSCDVETNTHRFNGKIDITDYPGDTLKIGDRIGYREEWNTVRIESSKTRNGASRPSSTCFDWMPCWDR